MLTGRTRSLETDRGCIGPTSTRISVLKECFTVFLLQDLECRQVQSEIRKEEDGTPLVGELPPNKHKLVVAWIEIHQENLLADWNLAINGKNPFPIKGLDQ